MFGENMMREVLAPIIVKKLTDTTLHGGSNPLTTTKNKNILWTKTKKLW